MGQNSSELFLGTFGRIPKSIAKDSRERKFIGVVPNCGEEELLGSSREHILLMWSKMHAGLRDVPRNFPRNKLPKFLGTRDPSHKHRNWAETTLGQRTRQRILYGCLGLVALSQTDRNVCMAAWATTSCLLQHCHRNP